MDPDVTFDEMVQAFDAGDYEMAYERAQYLADWLGRGGFAPDRPHVRETIDYVILRY